MGKESSKAGASVAEKLAILVVISKKDQQIQKLQDELSKEKDERREERFVFIFTSVILLDVVFFSVVESVTGQLSLIAFELILLSWLAKKMGVKEMVGILDRFLERVAKSTKKD